MVDATPGSHTLHLDDDDANHKRGRGRPRGGLPSSPPTDPKPLTKKQLATWIQSSIRTLERMLAQNKVPGLVRLSGTVKFNRATIEAWISDGCPTPRRGRPTS